LYAIIEIGLYGAAEPMYKRRLISFRDDADDVNIPYTNYR